MPCIMIYQLPSFLQIRVYLKYIDLLRRRRSHLRRKYTLHKCGDNKCMHIHNILGFIRNTFCSGFCMARASLNSMRCKAWREMAETRKVQSNSHWCLCFPTLSSAQVPITASKGVYLAFGGFMAWIPPARSESLAGPSWDSLNSSM